MKMKSLHLLAAVTIATCPLLLSAFPACADAITYTVDSTRSSLTISGTFAGSALQPESGTPGSLTTSYTGTIVGNRDFLADTLQITGGAVAAQSNGARSPIGVSYGSGYSYPLACYAFTTGPGFHPPSTGSTGAILGLTLFPTTPPIGSPTSFDASLFSAAILLSELDCVSTNPNVAGFFFPINGNLTFAPGAASLADLDGVETLTFSVSSDFTYVAQGQPLEVHFSGSMVATAGVPEPASLVLFGTLTSVLFLRRRRGAR